MLNDELVYSGLKEISNIGTGNAINTLSQLLEMPVDQLVPQSTIISFSELHQYFSEYEVTYKCGIADVAGDVDGLFLLLLDNEVYDEIIAAVRETRQYREVGLDKTDDEIFLELSDTIIDTYLKAVTIFLNVTLEWSEVVFIEDVLLNILSIPASKFVEFDEDFAITYATFKSHLEDTTKDVEGRIIYIPGSEAIKKVMQKLMVN